MHKKLMKAAIAEAKKAYNKNEVPIGCVSVIEDKIIARTHNLRETNADPMSHAEILCLKKTAKKLGNWHLNDVTLYVTLEPCIMCSGAIIHARIRNVVIGAASPKDGAARLLRKNNVKVKSGVLKEESGQLIKEFFKRLRTQNLEHGT